MKITEGQILDNSEPFAHVLLQEFKGKYCDGCCIEKNTLKQCGGCKKMCYCSKECQIKDWNRVHRLECETYNHRSNNAALHSEGSSLLRLALRLHLMFDDNENVIFIKHKTYDGKYRCYEDMVHFTDDILSQEWTVFKKVMPNMDLTSLYVDSRSLITTIGKIMCNSFSICNYYNARIGLGIYISASVFDHSCRPNCDAIFTGLKLEIRAMKTFDTEKEPPTISYIDLTRGKEERQLILQDRYHFTCHCSRCVCNEFEEEVFQLEDLSKKCDLMIKHEMWTLAYQIALAMLPLCEKLYGPYHSELTVRYLRVAEMLINSHPNPSTQEVNYIMKKVYQAIPVTHGIAHPFNREIVRGVETAYYYQKRAAHDDLNFQIATQFESTCPNVNVLLQELLQQQSNVKKPSQRVAIRAKAATKAAQFARKATRCLQPLVIADSVTREMPSLINLPVPIAVWVDLKNSAPKAPPGSKSSLVSEEPECFNSSSSPKKSFIPKDSACSKNVAAHKKSANNKFIKTLPQSNVVSTIESKYPKKCSKDHQHFKSSSAYKDQQSPKDFTFNKKADLSKKSSFAKKQSFYEPAYYKGSQFYKEPNHFKRSTKRQLSFRLPRESQTFKESVFSKKSSSAKKWYKGDLDYKLLPAFKELHISKWSNSLKKSSPDKESTSSKSSFYRESNVKYKSTGDTNSNRPKKSPLISGFKASANFTTSPASKNTDIMLTGDLSPVKETAGVNKLSPISRRVSVSKAPPGFESSLILERQFSSILKPLPGFNMPPTSNVPIGKSPPGFKSLPRLQLSLGLKSSPDHKSFEGTGSSKK